MRASALTGDLVEPRCWIRSEALSSARGRTGSAGVLAVVWVTVLLKLLAAILGLVVVFGRPALAAAQRRLAQRMAWTAALILILYGGVLSITGWLVQLDIVSPAANADHKALRWHAYLWDPWFLVWGLLLAAGLACSRQSRAVAPLVGT